MESLLIDLFRAYYDARKNKRNTNNQIAFEIDFESSLIQLYHELLDGTYTIGPSICFLICDTVPREIFAASFRDRVVHHLLYNYIYDICDKQFIHDSYSCRVGKGTHYGVKRVDHFIRSCSQNYSRNSYVLKLDITGFFMSIDKEKLSCILRHILAPKKDIILCDRHRLRCLLIKVIDHDPTQHYSFQGSRDLYQTIPSDKSLFASLPGVGLPIGNLTSQLFANVYLHILDTWMKHTLGLQYYGRYVDDFIIVHENKDYLTSLIPLIKEFLYNELGLILHPKKIYLQHYSKGVRFLGAYIKPYRTYIHRRTIGNAKKRVVNKKLSTINSYLGMMQHYKSYTQRKKICHMIQDLFVPSADFSKVTPKPHGTCRTPSCV